MLYVIEGESGGNPLAKNPTSSARGLVQGLDIHGVDFSDPETAIRWAANRVYNERGDWGDWGEGVLHEGKPFGVLGVKPYGGAAAAARAIPFGLGAPLAGALERRVNGPALLPPAQREQPPEPETRPGDEYFRFDDSPYRREAILKLTDALPDEARRFAIDHYESVFEETGAPADALQSVRRMLENYSVLRYTNSLRTGEAGERSEEDSMRVAQEYERRRKRPPVPEGTWETLLLNSLAFTGLGAPLKGAGIAARFLGPGTLSVPRFAAANLAGDVTAQAAHTAAQAAGAPPVVETAAGFGAGALGYGLAAGLRPPKMRSAAVEEGWTDPTPLPGQMDIFGDIVGEGEVARLDVPPQKTPPAMPLGGEGIQPNLLTGQTAEGVQPGFGALGEQPPPLYHATDPASAEQIRREGLRPGSFLTTDRETAIGRVADKGQEAVVLEFDASEGVVTQSRANPAVFQTTERLRPRGGVRPAAQEPVTNPATIAPTPASQVSPLPPVNGMPRERRVVKASDLTYRPDLFQARDADPGMPFGETRVNQIVRAFDESQFTTPGVVPDPQNPGKYIVTVGHHRTEAYRRVKGADADIEVEVTHADLTNPEQLRTIQRIADQSNFTTAAPNYREQIGAAERAQARGESIEDIAGELRVTASQAEALFDASRVGRQAIDRVVTEPGLKPYLEEVGRGMRVYGLNAEDANGLFNRWANTKTRQRPTPSAARETIDTFGALLQQQEARKAQGALFDAAGFEGFRGGLLGLIDDNARIRTELQRQLNALSRARRGVQMLAGQQGAKPADLKAAQRLADLGTAEEQRIRDMLARNEENLARAMRGEEPLPEPAPPAPPADPPEAPGIPPAPPPPQPIGNEPIDQLIAYVQAAGAVRPDLLAARRTELGKRVAAAAQELTKEGVPPSEAFARSTAKLKGQLADPSFTVPGNLDAEALHKAIVDAAQAGDVQYFTGLDAAEGLTKLSAGLMPQPSEVRALGQVFGFRLQEAIEEMGEIFAVQKRAEIAMTRDPIRIEWPDGKQLTPDDLAAAMRANLPDVDEDTLTAVAERMVQAGDVSLTVDNQGRRRVTFRKNEQDALQRAANEAMYERSEDVPSQFIPPTEPSATEYQPSLAEGEGRVTMGGPYDLPIPPASERERVLRLEARAQQPISGPSIAPRDADPLNMQGQPTTVPMQRVEGPANYRISDRTQDELARERVRRLEAVAQRSGGAADPNAPQYRGERDKYDPQFGFAGREWKPEQESLTENIFTQLWALTSFPKAMLAGIDRSAVIRQGGPLIRHGAQVREAFAKTLIIAEDAADAAKIKRATGIDVPSAEEVMREVHTSKWAKTREIAGLFEEEWGPGARLDKRNEQFMSKFARLIPGGPMAERAFVVYLNKLRADVFDSIMDKWTREGRSFIPGSKKMITEGDIKALATYINAATGRGDLGAFEGAAMWLSRGFFSPRLLIARYQVLAQFFAPNTPWLVRQEMAKDLATYYGAGITLLTLADLSGLAEVELDPRSADFGKMRIGDTRIDIWGGHQQMARYMTQFATGQTKSSTGEIYDIDRMEVVTRYLRSKLSPSAGFGLNLAFEEDMKGDKFDLLSWNTVAETFTPLFLQDIHEAVKENGLKGLAYAPLSFLGAGVQTYTTAAEERNRERDKESMARHGVKYADLPEKFPDRGFSLQEEINQLENVKGKVEKAREVSADTDYGQQRTVDDQVNAIFQKRQDDAEAAFDAGTLPKPLPEIYSDINKERAGARLQRELQRDPNLPAGKYSALLDGYFDKVVYEDGVIDWDATEVERERYLETLTPDDQARLDDFLGVTESRKSEKMQRYHKYLDEREALGYYREGITPQELQELDRANPAQDVANWYWKGGVNAPGAKTPVLQSAEAVQQALAMNTGRPVKIEGLARPINQDEGSLAGWERSQRAIDVYFNGLDRFYDAEARRLYGMSFEELKVKRPGNVASVVGNIREQVRAQTPELDAWLMWWGATETLQSVAAAQVLSQITQQYGKTKPKEGWAPRLAENAR